MASTYSDRLKLELMETGANANTWGNNTNTNLETLDAFTAGYLDKSVAGSSNVTLTTNNADPTAESSNKVIEFSGALTGNIYVFIPAVESNYIFYNNTSGAYTLTVAPDGHSANGVAIVQGAHTIIYNTSTACKDLFAASLGNLSVVNDISVGGTFTGNASGASALNASNLASGTLPDARFPATLPNISGANLTNLNASNVSSGTLPVTSGENLTSLNASNVSSGTLSNDRLDTVPTTKGGTGLTSIGTAGQVLTVAAPGTSLEFATAATGSTGELGFALITATGTYSPPADLKSAKVVVYGGGGGSGQPAQAQGGQGKPGGKATKYINNISGPVSVTIGAGGVGGLSNPNPSGQRNGRPGGTTSFGAFVSATGGGGGTQAQTTFAGTPGVPGAGVGGDWNEPSRPQLPDDGWDQIGFYPKVGYHVGGISGPAGGGAAGLVIVEEHY